MRDSELTDNDMWVHVDPSGKADLSCAFHKKEFADKAMPQTDIAKGWTVRRFRLVPVEG